MMNNNPDQTNEITQGESMNPVEIKENTKKVVGTVLNKLQVYGFWCLLVLFVGFGCGVKYCNWSRANATKDSILQGTFIYDGAVYEVKKRVVQ
jgi:glutamine synthetase type III